MEVNASHSESALANHAAPGLLRILEPLFTVLCLLHYGQAILPLLITGGASEGGTSGVITEDYTISVVLFLIMHAITLFLLVLRWKKVLQVMRKDGWIWALVGLALLSCLWSAAPMKSITSGIALVGSTLFGLYFATRYTVREQLQLLATMYGLVLLLSILFAVLPPHYGIMEGLHAGRFRGVFTHKNIFGKTMVPAGMVFLLLGNRSTPYKPLLWFGFITLVVLLILAGSNTAQVNLLLLLVAMVVYRILRWRYDRAIVAGFAIAALLGGLLLLLLDNIPFLLGLLNKDTTLSGRTGFWPSVMDMISKQPWLGYGFNAFWRSWEGDSANVMRAARWAVPDSHNGLLDLWLGVGAVGVVVFAIGFWLTVLRAANWVRISRSSAPLWPLLYLTYMVLANVTESTLLLQNNLFWMLYASVSFTVLSLPSTEEETTAERT